MLMMNFLFKKTVLLKQLPIFVLTLASLNVSANEFDSRQAIELNEENKAQLLSNMRGALSTTQLIMNALAANDMKAVAEHARVLGFKVRQAKGPNALHTVLPKSFKMLGKAMHQNFDKIAEDAETLQDSKHTLQQLAGALNSCQGCHATFRIDSPSAAK